MTIFIINWQKVRTLGELQVLTKASYLVLVLVPILAGLWPGVKIFVNQYNQAVTDSRAALEFASERLNSEAMALDFALVSDTDKYKVKVAEKAYTILDNLKNQVDRIIEDYSLKTIEKNALPMVWAEAFLASLLVLFAHLIYQAMAPEIVRQSSIQQYGIDRRNLQAENPSEGVVNRARNYLLIERHWITEEIELDYQPSDSEELRKWELDVVEKGAYAEYHHHSKRKLFGAWSSGILYLIAIILLFKILIQQTYSVLRAAEIL